MARTTMFERRAEGDPPEALEQTTYVFDHLAHPEKAMRILTAEEGA